MDEKPRPLLLILSPAIDNYGLSRTATVIADHAVLTGYKVQVCFPKARDTGITENLFKKDHITYVPLPMNVIARSEFSRFFRPKFLSKLIRNHIYMRNYVRQANPDVIHVMSAACIFVLFSLYGVRKNVILSLHESPRSRLEARVISIISRKFSSIQIACSNYVKEVFKLPLAKVIHSGGSVHRFAESKPQVPNLESPIKMVCIGRLNSWKGQVFLLKVAAKLKEEGLKFSLDIIGSSFPGEIDYSLILKDEIRYHGLEESVQLLGEISNWEDRASHYSFCFVPSQRPEPFGKVIIEAMAAGLIVIASDKGGPRDVITDQFNGFLVHPTDVDAYVACVKKTVSDLDLWKSISTNATKRALEFTESKTATLYLQESKKVGAR